VALEDLGSTNGTFINSSRLSPNQPEDLHNGDEIRLGNLFARVYFSGSRV
jgi:pSer/pThr/pTyr-binding forkhead associated (FHA) protein